MAAIVVFRVAQDGVGICIIEFTETWKCFEIIVLRRPLSSWGWLYNRQLTVHYTLLFSLKGQRFMHYVQNKILYAYCPSLVALYVRLTPISCF